MIGHAAIPKSSATSHRLDSEGFATDPISEKSIADLRSDQQKLQAAPTPPVQAETRDRIAALTKSLDERAAKNPDSVTVQHSAARFALQAGDTRKALERAERTLQLAEAGRDPDVIRRTLLTRSMARAASKDFGGACADAQRVLKDEPRDATAIEMRLFNCERPASSPSLQTSDTFRWLAQQTPSVPHTPEQWAAQQKRKATASFGPVTMSMQALKTGDAAAALRHAESAVGADSDDPMAWAQRGLARSRLDDYNGAILDLSRAIALGMVWNVLYKLRAEALIKARQYKAAVADASVAVSLDPKDASAYAARATARLGAGQAADDVLADFEAAAKLDPSRYQSAFARARGDLARTGASAGASAAAAEAGGDRLPLSDAQRRALAGWRAGEGAGSPMKKLLLLGGAAALLALAALALYQKRSDV